MICERCKNNPATVFVKTVLASQVREQRLCASCAGIEMAAIESVLPPLFSLPAITTRPRAARTRPPCPDCGATLASFRETGYLGCPACYGHFAEALPSVLRELHGKDRHRGKAYPPLA